MHYLIQILFSIEKAQVMEYYVKGNSSPVLGAVLRCLLEFLHRHSSVTQRNIEVFIR